MSARPSPEHAGSEGRKAVDRMALDFLDRVGSDCIGVIDTDAKLAAAIVFLDLNKRGLVIASLSDDGPVYRLTSSGRAALRRAGPPSDREGSL